MRPEPSNNQPLNNPNNPASKCNFHQEMAAGCIPAGAVAVRLLPQAVHIRPTVHGSNLLQTRKGLCWVRFAGSNSASNYLDSSAQQGRDFHRRDYHL